MPRIERAELIDKLRELDWDGAVKLLEGVVASVRVCTGLWRDEAHPPRPGATKLGGKPDLPPSSAWPGPNLVFLAQIDLAEYATLDPSGLLPRQGTLYFFAGEDEGSNAWLEATKVRVLCREGEAEGLVATDNPDAASLASGAGLAEKAAVLGRCFEVDMQRLLGHDLAFEVRGVLAHANGGEGTEECSRVLPRYSRPPAEHEEEEDEDAGLITRAFRASFGRLGRWASSLPGQADDRVLLQLRGADLARMGDKRSVFGENTLYFCIADADLAKRRFDRVRLWVGGGT
jgi:hypothetical protein